MILDLFTRESVTLLLSGSDRDSSATLLKSYTI